MTTHPEIRPDKNGNFVTRHIRDFRDGAGRSNSVPVPVAPGELVTCSFCSTQFTRGAIHRCKVKDLIDVTAHTKSILKACQQAGGRPLIVGGSVRDAILNRLDGNKSYKPKDIDIEVYGIEDPATLIQHLSTRGTVNETGVSFGVIKIKLGDEDFDVSLPRRDSKSGTGHRGFDVEFDPTIGEVEAFGRRDFTINAMGYDVDTQELVDPYGGTQDLADGILRHTTSAFAEDPLRVLRGVQFAARFGFDMAPETADEAARIKDSFNDVAVERVWGEFEKIFEKGTHISKAIGVLKETGWMEHFPELGRMEDVEQDPNWHPEGNVLVHLGMAADKAADMAVNGTDRFESLDDDTRKLLVFTAMVHDLGKFGEGTQVHVHEDGTLDKITSLGHPELGEEPIRAFAKRIGAPKSLVDPAVKLVREHMSHVATTDGVPSSRAIRNLVRRLGDSDDGANLRNWAILVDADHGGRGTSSRNGTGWVWYDKASEIDSVRPAKPFVNGGMLKDIGLKPDPIFKEIIQAAQAAQDNEEITDAISGEAWAREYITRNGLDKLSPTPARIR